ncbi:MAG: hypothetical protein DWQ58_01480 [Microcystis aeruginosa TA09]|nr:MAG: hypothetical protein DWQ58_01480 [Microcystis aeruginosa TA09]
MIYLGFSDFGLLEVNPKQGLGLRLFSICFLSKSQYLIPPTHLGLVLGNAPYSDSVLLRSAFGIALPPLIERHQSA